MKSVISLLIGFILLIGCTDSSKKEARSEASKPSRSIASLPAPTVSTMNCHFGSDLISLRSSPPEGWVMADMTYEKGGALNNQAGELNGKPLQLKSMSELRSVRFTFSPKRKCSLKILIPLSTELTTEAEIKCDDDAMATQILCQFTPGPNEVFN